MIVRTKIEPRFLRQVRVADVGPEGQARLEAARVRVSGEGLAQQIEATYLERAGVTVERDRAAEPASDDGRLDEEVWADPAAREVALGARRAVEAIVRALLADDREPDPPA